LSIDLAEEYPELSSIVRFEELLSSHRDGIVKVYRGVYLEKDS
jgi:hypothetical protein